MNSIFSGSKSKWLPLYHRFVARVSRIQGVEVNQTEGSVAVGTQGNPMAIIRVTPSGLQCGLALAKVQLKSPRLKPVSSRSRGTFPKMSHHVLLSEPSDLDEELMTWIKVASAQVRISRS